MARLTAAYRIHKILSPADDNQYLTVQEISDLLDISPATVRRTLSKDVRFVPRWNDSSTRRIGWALSEVFRYHEWTDSEMSSLAFQKVSRG